MHAWVEGLFSPPALQPPCFGQILHNKHAVRLQRAPPLGRGIFLILLWYLSNLLFQFVDVSTLSMQGSEQMQCTTRVVLSASLRSYPQLEHIEKGSPLRNQDYRRHVFLSENVEGFVRAAVV